MNDNNDKVKDTVHDACELRMPNDLKRTKRSFLQTLTEQAKWQFRAD